MTARAVRSSGIERMYNMLNVRSILVHGADLMARHCRTPSRWRATRAWLSGVTWAVRRSPRCLALAMPSHSAVKHCRQSRCRAVLGQRGRSSQDHDGRGEGGEKRGPRVGARPSRPCPASQNQASDLPAPIACRPLRSGLVWVRPGLPGACASPTETSHATRTGCGGCGSPDGVLDRIEELPSRGLAWTEVLLRHSPVRRRWTPR